MHLKTNKKNKNNFDNFMKVPPTLKILVHGLVKVHPVYITILKVRSFHKTTKFGEKK